MDLAGDMNLEFFVINYLFGGRGVSRGTTGSSASAEPPPEAAGHTFCRDVLLQVGVPDAECYIVPLAYSPEVHDVPAADRRQRHQCGS